MGVSRALRASWLAAAAVLAFALVVGVTDRDSAADPAERVEAIAATIRCPACASQSSADSDAPAARAVRAEIAERVAAGESAEEIQAYFASRYGDQILLTPSSSGTASVVWVLPVAAVVVAAGGLAVAFRRWRRWAS